MIGFVGLGNMGEPMAWRLIEAGHELCVFDVAPAARARFAGRAEVAERVTDVAAAGTVLLMLPDSAVVERVVLDEGLLDRLAPGTVLVDMSSSCFRCHQENAADTCARCASDGDRMEIPRTRAGIDDVLVKPRVGGRR